MQDAKCLVPDCQAQAFAPAGTQAVCKDHFFHFLMWRRRRGPQMFHHYAAMTMEERDAVVAEWQKTLRLRDMPAPSAQQS